MSRVIKSAWPYIAGFLLATVFGFVCLVFYDTVFNGEPNIVMGDGKAWGWNSEGRLVIRYERGFTVLRSKYGDVQRTVRCVGSNGTRREHDFDRQSRLFEQGVYPPVARFLEAPFTVPTGSPCELIVTGVWRNRFAVSSEARILDILPFVVQAHAKD